MADETQSTAAEPGIDPPEPLIGEEAAGSVETGTEQKPEDKPPEEKGPEARAPEQYADFTIPEGVTFDEKSLTEFRSFAKEQDLTQEQAQKVLDYGADRIRARIEAPYRLWSEMQAKWQAEVKNDPEIGGTKFEQSIRDAALVFQPGESNPFVGTADEAKALRKALNVTGAGNNPAMVKLFVKMGKLLAEPGSLTGKPAPADRREALLKSMYPTMTR